MTSDDRVKVEWLDPDSEVRKQLQAAEQAVKQLVDLARTAMPQRPDERVEAFLEARAKMRGLDAEQIHSANDKDLTVTDLRVLIAQARALRTIAPTAADIIQAGGGR